MTPTPLRAMGIDRKCRVPGRLAAPRVAHVATVGPSGRDPIPTREKSAATSDGHLPRGSERVTVRQPGKGTKAPYVTGVVLRGGTGVAGGGTGYARWTTVWMVALSCPNSLILHLQTSEG